MIAAYSKLLSAWAVRRNPVRFAGCRARARRGEAAIMRASSNSASACSRVV